MNFQSYFHDVEEAAKWIRERISISPKIAVVLSGELDEFANNLDSKQEIDLKDIPHFPFTRAEGHSRKLVFGKHEGVPLTVLAGRCHYYEGHSPQMIVFPHFVLSSLGCEILLTTNAVGGINRKFKPGDIMAVSDHINMMGINPLIGLAIQRTTGQFTNMTKAYDRGLCELAKKTAKQLDIDLKEGVFIATSGPSYETKAEIAAYRKMGADAVGMSTVPEVIAANFLGMKVLALSCIANPAADLHEGEMSHAEVLANMREMAKKVVALLRGIVGKMGK